MTKEEFKQELKDYLKENLSINYTTKSRRVFGLRPSKVIQVKLEDEVISETIILDYD